MIHTQTIIVPTLFDETTAPKIDGKDVRIAAQLAKQKLDTELAKGWRIVHCNSIIYMDVAYMHYILERDDEISYPEQLLRDIVASEGEVREHMIEEAAAYVGFKE